jgi:predicted AAA+ superfamily ATPase
MVARFDEQSVPPTTTAIAELLAKYGPSIVLIDEWVAYLRQLWSRDKPVAAGTFDGHMTFVQSLTEAVKSVPNALLVVSLPASDVVRDIPGADGPVENEYEIGGTPGLEALRHLRSVIHRVESAWQPATIEESFEIVRRRIFKPFGREQDAGRDLVVQKFMDHYLRYSSDVPSEVMQPGYRASMRTAYPIHPELFDRLYKDWSTLERFQRTRGVLRLMGLTRFDGHPSSGVRPRKDVRSWRAWGRSPGAAARSHRSSRPRSWSCASAGTGPPARSRRTST